MGTFPFDILQVAALLHLTIRRQTPYGIYTDCPICGDQRGKMFLRIGENVYRCNICGVGGGMLDLYARVQGLGSNSEAYQDICEQLLYGDDFTIQEPPRKAAAKAPPRNPSGRTLRNCTIPTPRCYICCRSRRFIGKS